jgi:hypothetical protein
VTSWKLAEKRTDFFKLILLDFLRQSIYKNGNLISVKQYERDTNEAFSGKVFQQLVIQPRNMGSASILPRSHLKEVVIFQLKKIEKESLQVIRVCRCYHFRDHRIITNLL